MATIEEFVHLMNRYNVINPLIMFDGDYTYQSIKDHNYSTKKDMLVLNSKVDKYGNNMYESLVKNHFYDCINFDFLQDRLSHLIFPLLVNSLSDDGKNRELRFDPTLTLLNFVECMDDLDDTLDINQLCDKTKEWYRTQRRMMKDYKANRTKSEFAQEIICRYTAHPSFTEQYGRIEFDEITPEIIEKIDKLLPEEWIDAHILNFSTILGVIRRIQEYSSRKHIISEEQFRNCFEPETILLMTMKAILDNQTTSIKLHGVPDEAFVIVNQYVSNLRRLGIKNYDYAIKVYDPATKSIKKYTVADCIATFDRLYKKFEGVLNNFSLSEEQVIRMGLGHNMEAMDKFRQLIKEEDEKIIEADWNILSSGEVDRVADPRPRMKNTNDTEKKIVDEDEILYRKFIYQQTDYLKQIVGKDKFIGYVGYIYENGLVIFEKFYEEPGKIAQIQATYVMNFRNFVEFTQLSKPEIIDYIKNTDNPDIFRLYHTETWAERLNKLISSVEPTLESQVFAETLNTGVTKTRKSSDN